MLVTKADRNAAAEFLERCGETLDPLCFRADLTRMHRMGVLHAAAKLRDRSASTKLDYEFYCQATDEDRSTGDALHKLLCAVADFLEAE